jgi:hypothetical protein
MTASTSASIPDLKIAKVQAIRVWDHGPKGGTWTLPGLSHRGIMPTLWIILHQLESDWRDVAQEHPYTGDPGDELARSSFLHDALNRITPRYIQCLFSYVNFFCLLENGFGVLYDELRQLNRELDLKLKVAKKPRRNEYIEKLRRVRNNTVVHWGGPAQKHDLDSRAGRMWGVALPSAATDLVGLEFGYLGVVGAQDRVLKSLGETHLCCVAYLQQFDAASADLLSRIVAHMPIEVGTRQYQAV